MQTLSRAFRSEGEGVEGSVAVVTTHRPVRPEGVRREPGPRRDERGPRPELRDPGHCQAGIRERQQRNVNRIKALPYHSQTRNGEKSVCL